MGGVAGLEECLEKFSIWGFIATMDSYREMKVYRVARIHFSGVRKGPYRITVRSLDQSIVGILVRSNVDF
jgi:hypothetical protein